MPKQRSEERSDGVVTDRRSFLKIGAASLAGGATAIAASATSAQASQADESSEQDGLYKETAHVKQYYDLARF